MASVTSSAPPVHSNISLSPVAFRQWLADQVVADRLAWEADDGDPEVYAPGWQGDTFTPTAHDEAEHAGYELGYAHDGDARPPRDMDEATALRWWAGRNRGWLNRESDDAEWVRMHERRMAEAFGDPYLSDGEMIEAIGAVALREIGGGL